jgi:membrane-associated phospholipid phosphatase
MLMSPTVGLAQDAAGSPTSSDQKSTVQDQNSTDQKGPPAAVGEEGQKPTGDESAKPARGFFSALGHNLGDDLKHMPRTNSVYWLAGGGALALAVHPEDKKINAHLVNQTTDRLWTPGHIIGSTPVILGAAGAAYFAGRAAKYPRLQHLGMDEIEATILAEAFTEGLKLAVRRDRPLQIDGKQSSTYSFPSGHAMLTFATATVLQQHLGYKAGIPTYLVASYVAISRLHDNRHYASDVAFGAAMGVVIGRSVTWHGRNFYASPMLLPDGAGIQLALVH